MIVENQKNSYNVLYTIEPNSYDIWSNSFKNTKMIIDFSVFTKPKKKTKTLNLKHNNVLCINEEVMGLNTNNYIKKYSELEIAKFIFKEKKTNATSF